MGVSHTPSRLQKESNRQGVNKGSPLGQSKLERNRSGPLDIIYVHFNDSAHASGGNHSLQSDLTVCLFCCSLTNKNLRASVSPLSPVGKREDTGKVD